jgi:DNA-binding CsgD family transcriptional regulator
MDALVGRDAQLALLDKAVAMVLDGRTVVAEVSGAAGMGKTRMLAELERRAARAGLLVCPGRATQFEQGVPFGSYVEMLEPLTLRREGGPGTTVPAELRAAAGAAEPVSRPQVYASVRRMLAEATAPGVALLLDDVHWADPASLELTEHLIRKPPPGPLLLAVAFREADPPVRLVDAIGRLGSAAVLVDLTPLTPADLDVLLAGVPRRRRALVERAGLGNPLYIQALSRLSDHGLDEVAALTDQHRPQEADWFTGPQRHILAGLAAEITAQEEPVRRVAHVAAVVGDHATIDLVGYVSGLPAVAVTGAVDRLGRLGLIQADGARFGFRHPLMRAAAYALTGPAWRTEAHGRVAEYLRTQRVSRFVVAHHTERSARYGDEAAAAILAEAGIALAHEAPAQAARWLGTALRIMPDTDPDDERRIAIRLWYARALGRGGQLERSREVLHGLRRVVGPAHDQAETFSVAVARQLGDFAEAAATLNAQLARGGLDRLGEAKARIELSAVAAFMEEPGATIHHAERALELLDRGSPMLSAAAHTLRALGSFYGGDTAPARGYLADAVRLVDAAGDAELRPYVEIVSPLALTEIQLCRLPDAGRHLDRARRILDALGPSSASPYLLVMESVLAGRTGRLSESVALADEAMTCADRIGSPEMRAMAGAVRLRPLLWTSGPAAVLDEVGWRRDEPRSLAWWRINRVEVALAYAANRDWRTCLDLLGAPSQPWSAHPPVVVTRLAVLAVAYAGRGDLAAAESAGERAWAAALAADLAYERALAELIRAFLAYRTGYHAGAAELAEAAATGFGVAGTPIEEALAHHLAGVSRSVAGAADRAAEAFDRAEAGYTRCGATWLSSVLAGHRAPSAPEMGRSDDDPSLTAREWEIADRVAGGLRNKEIAAKLFLSLRTVESHLTRIFTKLEVRSRTAMVRRLAHLSRPEHATGRDTP